MAKEIRTVTYDHSLEQVGGALERAFRETGWNVDAVERSKGEILAGKRGWIGYRTVKINLEAQGSETVAVFEVDCKPSEFQELLRSFRETLSDQKKLTS
jgi:hypothetical protein